MKIWHISDSHSYHTMLTIPENIDIIIFSGDAANYRGPALNEPEMREFLTWFKDIPIKYKIMIAGNHDSSIESKLVVRKEIEDLDIIYLENEDITIEGIKIWGSPYTPTFGQWSFMKSRDKIARVWETIPNDTNIIVTHGPPKGILDLTYNMDGSLFRCGCNALKKKVLNIEPKFHLFGHIHNQKDIINAGTVKLSYKKTIFSNGSIVTDFEFGKITSNGNIIDYK